MSSADGCDETSFTDSLGSRKARRERPADRRRIPRHPRRRHPRRGRRGPRGETAVAGNAAVQSVRWSADDQADDPHHVALDNHRLPHHRIGAPPVRLGPPRRYSPGYRPGRRGRVDRLRGARGGTGGCLHAIRSIPVPPPRPRRAHRHRGAGVVGSSLKQMRVTAIADDLPPARASTRPASDESVAATAQDSVHRMDGGPGMRLPNTAHTSRPWRIHELTRDFRLEDVWALPTPGGPDDFSRLVEGIASGDPSQGSSRAARTLWAIRWKVGALLGWDGPEAGLGSRVPTLRDRLPVDLRDAPSGPEFDALPFTSLYLLDDEWAAEVANRTVHGVMHVGWVPDDAGGYRGQMAVLVKPNGLFGTAYMAAIRPVRHLIVYPPAMRPI